MAWRLWIFYVFLSCLCLTSVVILYHRYNDIVDLRRPVRTYVRSIRIPDFSTVFFVWQLCRPKSESCFFPCGNGRVETRFDCNNRTLYFARVSGIFEFFFSRRTTITRAQAWLYLIIGINLHNYLRCSVLSQYRLSGSKKNAFGESKCPCWPFLKYVTDLMQYNFLFNSLHYISLRVWIFFIAHNRNEITELIGHQRWYSY